jgi:hypothetical protein
MVAIKLTRSEHEEQSAFFDWVKMFKKSYPALWWTHSIPNAARRSKQLAAFMRREGLTAGVFDVFVPWPANGYHGLWIEFKRPPNKLTKQQEQFGAEMVRRGFKVAVVYTANAAIELVREYLGID